MKSEQEDILEEQVRSVFTMELPLRLHPICWSLEGDVLVVEMSKGPNGFGWDVPAYLNWWWRLSKC